MNNVVNEPCLIAGLTQCADVTLIIIRHVMITVTLNLLYITLKLDN